MQSRELKRPLFYEFLKSQVYSDTELGKLAQAAILAELRRHPERQPLWVAFFEYVAVRYPEMSKALENWAVGGEVYLDDADWRFLGGPKGEH
jgi:hypothetical protein